MKLFKKLWHTIAILLVTLVVLQQVATSFPIPKIPDWPEEDRSRQQQDDQYRTQQQPPDKCPRNLCKGRICEVICKNNPSEGGKLCNCDTYALRGSGPSFGDCNRLI